MTNFPLLAQSHLYVGVACAFQKNHPGKGAASDTVYATKSKTVLKSTCCASLGHRTATGLSPNSQACLWESSSVMTLNLATVWATWKNSRARSRLFYPGLFAPDLVFPGGGVLAAACSRRPYEARRGNLSPTGRWKIQTLYSGCWWMVLVRYRVIQGQDMYFSSPPQNPRAQDRLLRRLALLPSPCCFQGI